MKINSVRVRRNKTERPYEHKHVEVEILLEDGDSYEDALEYGEFLVAKGLGEIDEKALRKTSKYARFLEKESRKE